MSSFSPKSYYATSIDSSVMRAAGYHIPTKMLVIFFNSGTIWAYLNVPEEQYHNLTNAKSAGKYFNKNIRNTYEAEKMFTPREQTQQNG